jgi:hypothetical protein
LLVAVISHTNRSKLKVAYLAIQNLDAIALSPEPKNFVKVETYVLRRLLDSSIPIKRDIMLINLHYKTHWQRHDLGSS